MTGLIDLTLTMDPKVREKLPESLKNMAMVFSPDIFYLHPTDDMGKDSFCASMCCDLDGLPDGEGWGAELLDNFSTHCGTHVDAPLHSGSRCEGEVSRTICEISLNELFCNAIVLDVREWAKSSEEITVDMLDQALAATGCEIRSGDAVLIRTGQERYTVEDPEFFLQPGMSRASTLHLIEQGAKVLGTDAVGWDLPFPVMTAKYEETGDKSVLWDGHKAIVEKEAFIVQQLTNLVSLPLSGFKVGFFPIKLANCSAAPARVVAFVG